MDEWPRYRMWVIENEHVVMIKLMSYGMYFVDSNSDLFSIFIINVLYAYSMEYDILLYHMCIHWGWVTSICFSETWLSLGQLMVWCLLGEKTFSAPMLFYFLLFVLIATVFQGIYSQNTRISYKKSSWKSCLQNEGLFVSAEMSYGDQILLC